MKKKGTNRNKKKIIFLLLLLIAIVSFSVVSIFKDWVQIMNNKQQLSSLTSYYNNLLDEEESLNSEVTKLHDPDYVARYAREKYMYSLPGEFIIKVPNTNTSSEN